jgi:hypothetical protein
MKTARKIIPLISALALLSCDLNDLVVNFYEGPTYYVNNETPNFIAIGCYFHSDNRSRIIKEKYNRDVPSYKCIPYRIPPTNGWICCFEIDNYSRFISWEDHFKWAGIDSVTFVCAKDTASISRWAAVHNDSLIYSKLNLTLNDLDESKRTVKIKIKDGNIMSAEK